MGIGWTDTQKQRLLELGVESLLLNQEFEESRVREEAYQKLEHKLVIDNRKALLEKKNKATRPALNQLESALTNCLTQAGFAQVTTPIIISKNSLEKMTVTEDSDLAEQVFWVDRTKCLRPMLAPNLYSMMIDLHRICGDQVRIFEIGPCFRKESQGKYHLNEFTMLNLVEMGVQEGKQEERLRELIKLVMDSLHITDYRVEKDSSEVYGETIDVLVGDLELCSAAYGPHRLDNLWGVFTPWVGLGIGVERLAMVLEGHRNIKKVGRSLSYLYGHRLNIK
ncbi:MAG: pyrrolysine--tRNA(Pyl) ligase large subunit [Bacillota bacterium]|nr:pyrrolysine--tRNA(Pyl) ligase large subunit [Bacillota bacterium]